MRKKILVCGASGFIGRNLFEHWSQDAKFDVYGTYLSSKSIEIHKKNPKMWKADFTDKYTAQQLTKGFDYVINAAAMTDGIGAISVNPAGYIIDNIRINTNLIEASFINKVSHFIFLSCTIMYPSSDIQLTEHQYNLENIHTKYRMGARMKVFFEDLCKFYAKLGRTKFTAVRHTNIYGPYDKFDLKRGHVLSATIAKVMQANKEITVWGEGTESRDFLYINDLIQFINIAIDKQENNFEIFNIGYGRTYSINELVQIIILLSGKDINVVHDLTKPTVETRMNISVKKAWNILGWKAHVGLPEGLTKTIRWYLDQPR